MPPKVDESQDDAAREPEDLRRRAAFSRAVLERSLDLAAVVGPDGKFKFLSSSTEGLLGWPAREYERFTPGHDLVRPDDRPRVLAALEDLFSGAAAERRLTYRRRHKD